MKKTKNFLTYDQQIELLKSKKLQIPNEDYAKQMLKKYSYYSLITGYKAIFKKEKNGDYLHNAQFNNIVQLYLLDEFLRTLFFQNIVSIERTIKSLYSYNFCELYGDKQSDYLNKYNYNYIPENEYDINKCISKIESILNNADNYPYIKYNIDNYGSSPLWVTLKAMTFGSMSKMYYLSTQQLQSKIALEFNGIYCTQLKSILKFLTKFRNVCAHGERLYNYKTQTSLVDLPIHSDLQGKYNKEKNDLFNVLLCFKHLLSKKEFDVFLNTLNNTLFIFKLDDCYMEIVLKEMGFPENWYMILKGSNHSVNYNKKSKKHSFNKLTTAIKKLLHL